MKTNIPIYRGKKIDSEEYIEGSLLWGKYIVVSEEKFDFGSGNPDCEFYEIDPSTLSISFPDMLDSEGTKIFASLSEDGKGGDLADDYHYGNENNYMYKYRFVYGYGVVKLQKEIYDYKSYGIYGMEKDVMKTLKITGIQQ